MNYRLEIKLDPAIKLQIERNKRMWNFVKKDLAIVLATSEFDANMAITQTPDYGFILDHQANNQRIVIGPDLAFADGLALCLADTAFLALILAVVIRLHKSYVGAFSIVCDSYSVVDGAIKLLQKTLKMPITRNALSAFMDYPTPGRKPVKERPLTGVEIRREAIRKKRASGMASVSTWLYEPVKGALDKFCKTQGFTLDEALNKIIPIGIKTTCFVLTEFKEAS